MTGLDTTHLSGSAPQVPGFAAIKEIGAGGMARVFLARDTSLNRLAAIKIINAELDAPDFRARFEKEAQIVAQFRHAHIVAVYSSGRVGEQLYIAFEYEPGGTLADRIQGGGLPVNEAGQIARKIASALAYAHARGVVHRDVKPANILFDNDGQPILSDFGIAKPIDTRTHLTRTGLSIGSPRYMSPEQLMGERVDEKSDVFSLGLVLLEMLNGTLPTVATPDYIARSKGPRGYRELINRCLRAAPEDRPTALECELILGRLVSRRGLGGIRLTSLLGGVTVVAVLAAVMMLRPSEPVARFSVAPTTASVFVNGRPHRSGELPEGNALIAVVAPGYYGLATQLNENTADLDLQLQPLGLPDYENFQAFHARFEGQSATDGSDVITYDLYQRVLQLKVAVEAGESETVSRMTGEIASLAELGDAASQVEAFLLQSESLVDLTQTPTSEWLKLASDGGFALATYYMALDFRWRNESEGALDLTSLKEFRRLLALAQSQGLQFAQQDIVAVDEFIRSKDISGP